MFAASPAAKSVHFLKKKEEWALIVIPWVGVCAFLLSWMNDKIGIFHPLRMGLADLAVGVIFLDGMHIIYTFIMLLCIPELRQWTRAVGNYWGNLAVIGLTTAALFYIFRFSELPIEWPILLTTIFMLDVVGPSWHTLAQIRGISFCYHSALRKAGKVPAAATITAVRAERIERHLFLLLLFGDIACSMPMVLREVGEQAFKAALLFRPVGITAVVTAALGILINSRRFPGQEQTRKTLYLTRVLVFPLRLVAGPVGLVLRISHGTEYLVVLRQMVNNSALSESGRKRVLRLTLAASMVYIPVYVLTCKAAFLDARLWREPHELFFFALMIHFVIRYVHYYMDRKLYRMSNPQTRAVVSPLLVPPPKESAQVEPQSQALAS